jgi:hypothetical protein
VVVSRLDEVLPGSPTGFDGPTKSTPDTASKTRSIARVVGQDFTGISIRFANETLPSRVVEEIERHSLRPRRPGTPPATTEFESASSRLARSGQMPSSGDVAVRRPSVPRLVDGAATAGGRSGSERWPDGCVSNALSARRPYGAV